jgi:uncharacterized damage-inducible protein DinB
MSEVARIATEYWKSYNGDAWHGPALREALEGVTAAQAAARPIAGAHTIWELTAHVSGWLDAIRRRLEGEAKSVPHEGDFPETGKQSDEAWAELQTTLHERAVAFRQTVGNLTDAQLVEEDEDGDRWRYVTVLGVIGHNLYHAGQISLLKKA